MREVLERGGFLDSIGRDRVFDTKDDAIRAIYARLDAARCRDCEARIFDECQTALPDGTPRDRRADVARRVALRELDAAHRARALQRCPRRSR